jgi:dienelactone hydrolase
MRAGPDLGVASATATGTETIFRVACEGASVPAALWLPEESHRPPVVLLGHGGADHKTSVQHRQLADWFASNLGAACLSIDGPFHGERSFGEGRAEEANQAILAQGPEVVQRQMTREWLAVLSAVAERGLVNDDMVGYIGFSLGSVYGLPLCAELGSRLRAAAVGKVGTTCAAHLTNIASPIVLCEAASRITAPVLFQMQWDDEIFPRPTQLELFDLIGSRQKVLRAHPGHHSDTWPADEIVWREHVATHLRSAGQS